MTDSWIIKDETRFRRIDFRWPVEPAVSRRKLDVDGISVPSQFPAKRLAVRSSRRLQLQSSCSGGSYDPRIELELFARIVNPNALMAVATLLSVHSG